METVVSICNRALGAVGISRFIQDINERSQEATVLKQFYYSARDTCLEEFPWTFANSFTQLQLSGNPPHGWLYQYAYPNNCIKALDIGGRKHPLHKFAVIENEAGGGKFIVANNSDAVLRFTKRIENPNLFSAKFSNAFVLLLASMVATPLSADPRLSKLAGDAYVQAIISAGASTLNEGNEQSDRESIFLEARGCGGEASEYYESVPTLSYPVAPVPQPTPPPVSPPTTVKDPTTGYVYQFGVVDNGDGTWSEKWTRIS